MEDEQRGCALERCLRMVERIIVLVQCGQNETQVRQRWRVAVGDVVLAQVVRNHNDVQYLSTLGCSAVLASAAMLANPLIVQLHQRIFEEISTWSEEDRSRLGVINGV